MLRYTRFGHYRDMCEVVAMIKTIAQVLTILVLSFIIMLEGIKYIYIIAPVDPVVYSDKAQTLVLKGVVYHDDYPAIDRQHTHMPGLTAELVGLVKHGVTDIHIRIDSPGGRLREGMQFVHAMREAKMLGVRFTCVIDGRAMSMALILFSDCDNRYATFGSKIMWHSISQERTFFRVNEQNVSQLLEFFKAKNEEVWATTRIHFYPWYFTRHFAAESILSATEVERNSIRYLRVIRRHIVQ